MCQCIHPQETRVFIARDRSRKRINFLFLKSANWTIHFFELPNLIESSFIVWIRTKERTNCRRSLRTANWQSLNFAVRTSKFCISNRIDSKWFEMIRNSSFRIYRAACWKVWVESGFVAPRGQSAVHHTLSFAETTRLTLPIVIALKLSLKSAPIRYNLNKILCTNYEGTAFSILLILKKFRVCQVLQL